MTRWTRLDGRARSAAAVLLAALAAVGSLLVGPSAAVPVTVASAAAGAAARGAAPAGVALRDHRDVARSVLRRGAREQSAPRSDSSVRTALGHGPAPATAVLVTGLLLGALAVAGAHRRHSAAPVQGHAATSRRDRAPPAFALA